MMGKALLGLSKQHPRQTWLVCVCVCVCVYLWSDVEGPVAFVDNMYLPAYWINQAYWKYMPLSQ